MQQRLPQRLHYAAPPAYVSIRQHTSAYVRSPQCASTTAAAPPLCCSVSIRQHTSAYVSIRQHTSAYVSIRQHTTAYVSIRQHTSAYTDLFRQRASAARCTHACSNSACKSAYVSIRQHTLTCTHARLLGTGTGLASAMACFRSATCLRQCSMQVGERRKAAQAQRVHRPTNLSGMRQGVKQGSNDVSHHRLAQPPPEPSFRVTPPRRA